MNGMLAPSPGIRPASTCHFHTTYVKCGRPSLGQSPPASGRLTQDASWAKRAISIFSSAPVLTLLSAFVSALSMLLMFHLEIGAA
eukprot:2175555-Karenia_brevis.AAC.1